MYAPHLKNDRVFDVKHSLELLKVASQIEFDELMESAALALSSAFWSTEDEIKIREYSSSPDFPRNHAKDLTARLGLDILDKSELEDRHERLWLAINQIVCNAVTPQVDDSENRSAHDFVAELLESLCRPAAPYNFASKAIKLFNTEAGGMLANIERSVERNNVSEHEVMAICWALKALLTAKMAEELVPVFVHLHAIPKTLCQIYNVYPPYSISLPKVYTGLAEVVLLIYEEVVAGHLMLRTQERVALLANWHPFLKQAYPEDSRIIWGEPETKPETKLNLVTRQLFSTLPITEQMEFIKSQKNFGDFIINYSSLICNLSEFLASHGIGS